MTRKEFMKELDKKISKLDYYDKMDVFRYFEEYFDELDLKSEDEVPEDIDLKKVVSEILEKDEEKENVIKNDKKKYEDKEESEEEENPFSFFNFFSFGKKNKTAETLELEYKYEDISKINIHDGVSKIIIEKGEENSVSLVGININEANVYMNNGELTISDIGDSKKVSKNVISFNPLKSLNISKIIISYTDNLDEINIHDLVGKIDILVPTGCLVNIHDVVSSISLNIEEGLVDLRTKDHLCKINRSYIDISRSAKTKVNMYDMMGKMIIK